MQRCILRTLFAAFAVVAWPLVAGADLSFVTRQDYPAGSGPLAAAVVRLNGDRQPDLLVADSRGLLTLLGVEPEGFSSPTSLRTQAPPEALAVGDVNGDGHADAVTASTGSREVTVHHGDGAGGLTPAGRFAAPASITTLLLANANGDDRPDLLVGHREGLSLLVNNRRDGFAAPRALFTGFPVRTVLSGDFTGDGQADIVVLDPDRNALTLLAASAAGEFSARPPVNAGAGPRRAVAADITQDGHLDVALLDDRGVVVVAGDGTGGFGVPRLVFRNDQLRSIAAADLNEDGRQDLAVVDQRRHSALVLFGEADGSLRRGPQMGVGPGAETLLAADVTGDRRPDLVVLNRSGDSLTLLRATGLGRFAGPPVLDAGSDPTAATLADFDKDARLDAAVVNQATGTVHVLLGNGDGEFTPRTEVRVGRDPRALATADFDADGLLDLAVAGFASDDVAVLTGTGGGAFAAPVLVSVGIGPADVATGDWNGDGHIDLAVANSISDSVSVAFGDGHGRFPAVRSFPVIPRPEFLLSGDLNADRRADLVIGTRQSDRVSILKTTPAGFAPPAPGDLGGRVRPSISEDFNLDGEVDLVVSDTTGDELSILPGHGNGKFGDAIRFPVARQPMAAAAGDVNGDRLPDLLVINRGVRTVMLLTNDSRSSSKRPRTTVAPAETAAAHAGDPWERAAGGW